MRAVVLDVRRAANPKLRRRDNGADGDSGMKLSKRLSFPLILLALALSGCDLKLGNTDALWLLWLLPAVTLFYVYSFRSKTRIMQRFASSGMLLRIASGVSRPRQILKASLIVVAIAFTVLALSEPKYGFNWEEVKRQGVDIVVALDVSDSMLVEDVEAAGKLNRLERAKREVTDLLRLLEGDRVGLVAFAGTAFLECPLTLDYAAAEIFLDDIDTDLIPVKGTAIGDALRTSLKAFEGSAEDSRAIIVITDGEDHSGDALTAAEQAKVQNVRVFTIGIGRDEGAPIPTPGGGFRKDRNGTMVLSKLDETTLQKIALTTGGSYVRSVTGDVDLEKIYSEGIKATLEDQELASKRRQRWEERYQWVLALALLLLTLEPFINERRRRFAAKASVVLLALMVLTSHTAVAQTPPHQSPPSPLPGSGAVPVPSPPQLPLPNQPVATTPVLYENPHAAYGAGAFDQALQGFLDEQVENPRDSTVLMNVGAAHYQMKNYEEAEKAFNQAAVLGDSAMRAKALYNLGNTAFRRGQLEEAVKLFQAALEHDPNDEDAKFNLEFVRDEIRRRVEEAKKRQEQQQQQQGDNPQQGEQDQQSGDEQQQDQQQQQGNQTQEQDSDQDGLPDQTEQNATNSTDPNNPDSDGDGLADGQEDSNQNGQVDPGETDPNKKDTDLDGIDDGTEAESQGQPEQPVDPQEMTPEQAQRFLQGLEEERPKNQRKGQGQRARPLKDW